MKLAQLSGTRKIHILTLGLKVLGLGKTLYLWGRSLASQVTSQIVEPEINVTFGYNPKKVRRAWSISQVIIDLILGWFLKNTQMQTRGSTELLFKNLLYDVHKEKVWRS